MLDNLRKLNAVKRVQKTRIYSRMRQYLPMLEAHYVDDRDQIEDAEIVRIDWPKNVVIPRVGIVKDFENFPRWTKYCRFLEKNSFPYTFYDIHSHDWIENAQKYDVVVGIVSNQLNHLEEIYEKYYFLETYLGKKCFPSAAHVFLYENKSLEAYISKFYDIPFAKTYISHSKKDALALAANLHYPLVSKINYSSGSVGIELVRTPKQARRIIEQAFSRNGRKVHVAYFRQKNYVYFQEFIPNDGYDIRVILVGNWAFGNYRKVLRGDFRASGMDTVEKRALPEEAIRTAWKAQKCIKSPQLVVDMVRGLNGNYSIIEISPVCKVRSADQLKVNGIPGVYIIEDNGVIRFEKGRYWIHELALRKFLLDEYLPYAQLAHAEAYA